MLQAVSHDMMPVHITMPTCMQLCVIMYAE